MNIFRKMAGLVRGLTLKSPTGWMAGDSIAEAGEYVTESSVLTLSTVWACLNLICGTSATLPCQLYRPNTSGGRELDRGHPLYRLLHDSPNYDQTAVDFWEYMFASLELWGNAYARIERSSRGQIVALIPVAPSLMTVRRLATGAIEYQWAEDGRSYVETDKNVFHIRGFGGNPLGGMSTLHFARNTFGLARAIDRAAGVTFKNGLRPSGSFVFPNFLGKENRAVAEEKLIEKYTGSMNAGRPLILEGGVTWQPITINPEDAQMLESRAFSVEEICRFFGTPPFMVGHSEKSTSFGTGIEQQTIGFEKYTLRRRLKRVEQAIYKQLLSPEDRAAGVVVEFNIEGLLRGDSASRAAFYESGLRNGWLVINEVRGWQNLPPVEGGEVPRMQSQNVPITQAAPPALAN